MSIKIVKGFHLTATEKRHINYLLKNNLLEGKINRTSYWIAQLENGNIQVKIGKVQSVGLGMIGEQSGFKIETYEIANG